jgi:hypothetical protein
MHAHFSFGSCFWALILLFIPALSLADGQSRFTTSVSSADDETTVTVGSYVRICTVTTDDHVTSSSPITMLQFRCRFRGVCPITQDYAWRVEVGDRQILGESHSTEDTALGVIVVEKKLDQVVSGQPITLLMRFAHQGPVVIELDSITIAGRDLSLHPVQARILVLDESRPQPTPVPPVPAQPTIAPGKIV